MLDFILNFIVDPILEYFTVPASSRKAEGGKAAWRCLLENLALWASMGCFILTAVGWEYQWYLLMIPAVIGTCWFGWKAFEDLFRGPFRAIKRWREKRERDL